LALEIRKRQQYISHSARASEEIQDIRQTLDDSLKKVTYKHDLDPLLLEHESRKLDDMVERMSPVLRHKCRSPTRAGSPPRVGFSSSMGRSGSLQRIPVPLRSSMRK